MADRDAVYKMCEKLKKQSGTEVHISREDFIAVLETTSKFSSFSAEIGL